MLGPAIGARFRSTTIETGRKVGRIHPGAPGMSKTVRIQNTSRNRKGVKPWIRIRAAHRLLAERRWCCPGHAPNDPFQKPEHALDQVGVGGFQHGVEMVAQFGEEGYANGSWAGTPPEHHRKWLQISELYDPHRSNTGVAPE